MKKFRFSLEKVLKYKDQILENLQVELKIFQKQKEILDQKLEHLNQEYARTNMRLRSAYAEHITPNEISSYKAYLTGINKDIQDLEQKIKQAEQIIVKKQQVILETKTEISSYETLKDKQFEEYLKQEKKQEELFIEEFVNFNSCRSS